MQPKLQARMTLVLSTNCEARENSDISKFWNKSVTNIDNIKLYLGSVESIDPPIGELERTPHQHVNVLFKRPP